jgi:Flp pilus assembly protein TadG
MSLIRRSDPRRGNAGVEFGLLAPVLFTLFLGTAEAVVYLRSWFTLERVAAEVTNITTQQTALGQTTVCALFSMAQSIAGSVNVTSVGVPAGTGGRTVITGLSGNGTTNTVLWQISRGEAATVFASRFGAVGSSATLPNSVLIPSGQTLIATEVFTSNQPWIFDTGGTATLALLPARFPKIATFAAAWPRNATLSTAPTPCP